MCIFAHELVLNVMSPCGVTVTPLSQVGLRYGAIKLLPWQGFQPSLQKLKSYMMPIAAVPPPPHTHIHTHTHMHTYTHPFYTPDCTTAQSVLPLLCCVERFQCHTSETGKGELVQTTDLQYAVISISLMSSRCGSHRAANLGAYICTTSPQEWA